MSARSWHLTETLQILRACRTDGPRTWTMLGAYYVLIPISAVLDGLSWILLVKVFTFQDASAALSSSQGTLDTWLIKLGFPMDHGFLLKATIVIFAIKAVATVGLGGLEGIMQALLRRRIQERCFENLLRGRWDAMRSGNVGRWVGSLTEESAAFSKYVMSMLRAGYALLAFLILGGMAFVLDPRTCLLLAAVGVPAWAVLKLLYTRQAALSRDQVRARQGFAADITERLEGLFQIKAAGEIIPYLKTGLRRQDSLTSAEISLGWIGGVLLAFNAIMVCVGLAAYALFQAVRGGSVKRLDLLGGVGILGFRAVSQLNYLVSYIGTLTRLTGSVEPVLRMTAVPSEPRKRPLPEPLAGIRLEGVGYSFDGRKVLRDQNLSIPAGKTFLVTGPSGSGKTTLANIVAGLCEPCTGRLLYMGKSGKSYDAAQFQPKIGYVTQDVRLFSGTVRDNLDPFDKVLDDELQRCLREADATAFVERLGGLQGEVAEGGRSLSGGEKRRLAIARALAQRSDCLVLDEVTNGLDTANKHELLETIGRLGRRILIVAIAHDVGTYDAVDRTLFQLAATGGPTT